VPCACRMYWYPQVAVLYCPKFTGCTDIQKWLHHTVLCLQDVLISRSGFIILPYVCRIYWYPEVVVSYCPMFAGCTDIQKWLCHTALCLQGVLTS
jgi:hypothetical protein